MKFYARTEITVTDENGKDRVVPDQIQELAIVRDDGSTETITFDNGTFETEDPYLVSALAQMAKNPDHPVQDQQPRKAETKKETS